MLPNFSRKKQLIYITIFVPIIIAGIAALWQMVQYGFLQKALQDAVSESVQMEMETTQYHSDQMFYPNVGTENSWLLCGVCFSAVIFFLIVNSSDTGVAMLKIRTEQKIRASEIQGQQRYEYKSMNLMKDISKEQANKDYEIRMKEAANKDSIERFRIKEENKTARRKLYVSAGTTMFSQVPFQSLAVTCIDYWKSNRLPPSETMTLLGDKTNSPEAITDKNE